MTPHRQLPSLPAMRVAVAAAMLVLLGACTALPDKPVRPLVYDFGPGAPAASEAATAERATAATLTLAEVQTPLALDGTAMLYRLLYADPTQLRTYAQARWSMPPAQLLRQRLRAGLARKFTVMLSEQGRAERQLRIEVEEFSQVFETPDRSSALLRLNATLMQGRGLTEQLLAQRSFTVQLPAPSADAPGGVRALASASDAVVTQLEQWLLSVR